MFLTGACVQSFVSFESASAVSETVKQKTDFLNNIVHSLLYNIIPALER